MTFVPAPRLVVKREKRDPRLFDIGRVTPKPMHRVPSPIIYADINFRKLKPKP